VFAVYEEPGAILKATFQPYSMLWRRVRAIEADAVADLEPTDPFFGDTNYGSAQQGAKHKLSSTAIVQP
jgi:hypothetical protein